ncbi:MAG: hypothetical protein KatS3mg008_1594 [Acidimicrobiales bacterium]|nr:MAG: hypothetical protein KatS3mg008_1594 [Acidimicrobiales bacterium]
MAHVSVTISEIESADQVDDEVVAAFARMIPQLSSTAAPPDEHALSEIASSPATVLFVASCDGRIVGSLTLALFRIPTGMRAWIEDVVVDEGYRGRGVGSALCRAALERAKAAGARTVDLTSRPTRVEANRLYERLGFAKRETNVYRFDLDRGDG